MQLIAVASPRLFPDFVACYSALQSPADQSQHFAAGRICASRAISLLEGAETSPSLPRGATGEPIWPVGMTGSITHSGDFVSAAVARSSTACAVGLDAEHIISTERARRVAPLVAHLEELSLGNLPASLGLTVTLLFSIKEAAFKCLFPLVRRRFYYSALRVTHVDFSTGTFRAALTEDLPPFAAGHRVSGQFQVDAARVYAGLWLPEPASGDAI